MRWGILAATAITLLFAAPASAQLPTVPQPVVNECDADIDGNENCRTAVGPVECTTASTGDSGGSVATTTCTAPLVTVVLVQDVDQSYRGGTHDNSTVTVEAADAVSAECAKTETHPQDTGPSTYGAGCESTGVEAGVTLLRSGF